MVVKHTIKRLSCMFLAVVMILCLIPPVQQVSAAGVSAGNRLSGIDKQIYDYLKEQIIKIAEGKTASTEISLNSFADDLRWTKEELGVSTIAFGGSITAIASAAFREKLYDTIDIDSIIQRLLADCAYELFWYDKVSGYSFGYMFSATQNEMWITSLTLKLNVSSNYAVGQYMTNLTKIKATSTAINNAKAIVKKHAAKSDYDKLVAYRDEICALVEYNHTAAGSATMPYGDPWQLIYVFDKNPSTNVVCEGYSKAFQFLCELSTFQGDVSCYTVSGYMQGGTGAGKHMWNVVKIDGGTLMVDITNCDAGSVGAPDKLFLKVGTKTGNIYAFTAGKTTIYYTYDQSEYGLYTDGYLELKPTTGHLEETCGHEWSTSWTSDSTEHYHSCSLCGERKDAAKHTYSAATCTKPKTCKVCGYTSGKKLGHSYTNACDTTCNTCGAKRTASHDYETITTKATLTKNGSVVKKCKDCGKVASTTTIKYAKTFKLSATSYTYDGKAKTPTVTVKDSSGKTLNKNVDYTVTYSSGRKNPGTYKVTIKMKGDYSGTKTLTFDIKLATPKISVSNASDGVKVSWDEVSGAKSYTVYKSTYSSGKWSSWKAVKTGLTGTSYTDKSVKSNTKVKYYVRAINGKQTADSKSVSIQFLATPKATISNTTDGVKVSWGKVSGAKTYTVYKSTYSGGKWSSWKAVKTGLTGTSYTDKSVKSNTKVKYYVRAINGKQTADSKSVSIQFLATPKVAVSTATDGVKVSWGKVSGAKKYTVYKSTYSNGKWSDWKAVKSGVTGTSYTDKSVKSNTTVKYAVRAVNGENTSTIKSSSSIKYFVTPTVNAVIVSNGIKLTWNKISGAKSYEVYRRTYSNGKWSEWKKIKVTTATNYTDKTVKNGVSYQYSIHVNYS